jgi:hypothetical protein
MSLPSSIATTRGVGHFVAVIPLLLLWASPAKAQVGALYRCATNEFTNMLTPEQATAQRCTKIAKAEWIASGSDWSGRNYAYNERRTVFKGNGLVETWLQVANTADANDAHAAVTRTVSRQVIECDRRTIASGAAYVFDPRDNSVVRDSREQNPYFPPPEVVAETLIRRLCGNGRAPR